jgi:hypothetical protein
MLRSPLTQRGFLQPLYDTLTVSRLGAIVELVVASSVDRFEAATRTFTGNRPWCGRARGARVPDARFGAVAGGRGA